MTDAPRPLPPLWEMCAKHRAMFAQHIICNNPSYVPVVIRPLASQTPELFKQSKYKFLCDRQNCLRHMVYTFSTMFLEVLDGGASSSRNFVWMTVDPETKSRSVMGTQDLAMTMAECYRKWGERDGIIWLEYSLENTFGDDV
jgi:hypothetical protein